jgi:hypothetical protein
LARIAVDYEQAVYGTFPFWDRGYAVLAHSPGCRPEWLSALRDACQRFGERPAGAIEAPSLFALPLEGSGPWVIVGVRPQGRDDQGRPGALAFHALFVDRRAYRRAGAFPFDFAPALRGDWSAETRSLPAGTLVVDSPRGEEAPPSADRAARLAQALARGQRLALAAPEPIDALARQVWRALPLDVRARASVATWAFGNGNRFDLVALPRLAGVPLDASYVDESALQAEAAAPASLEAAPASRGRLRRAFPALCVGAVLLGAWIGLAWRGDDTSAAPAAAPPPAPRVDHTAAADRPAPPRPRSDSDLAGAVDPDERRRVSEGLSALAERLGVLEGRLAARDDPAALMAALAALRYTGPLLEPGELAELNDRQGPGSSRDRALALRWHAAARRLAADRPLPADFARGPLRWQLDTLAWSFHLDAACPGPGPGPRTPDEVVHALAEALTPELSLRPLPLDLTRRYPALDAYRAFLTRLEGR